MNRINQFIKECCINSKDAATKLGVTQGAISDWKKDKRKPPIYIDVSIKKSILIKTLEKRIKELEK